MNESAWIKILDQSVGKYVDNYLNQLAQMAANTQHMAQISAQLQYQIQHLEALNTYSPDEMQAVVLAHREKRRKEQLVTEKARRETDRLAEVQRLKHLKKLTEEAEIKTQLPNKEALGSQKSKHKPQAESALTVKSLPKKGGAEKSVVKILESITRHGAGLKKIGPSGELLPDAAAKWNAVLDQKTNLMWMVDVSNISHNNQLTPQETKSYEDKINSQRWCGYDDWYIPSLDELKTVVTQVKSVYYRIHEEFFPDMRGAYYWSASVFSNRDKNKKLLGEAYWAINFQSGSAYMASRLSRLSVRLVRYSNP